MKTGDLVWVAKTRPYTQASPTNPEFYIEGPVLLMDPVDNWDDLSSPPTGGVGFRVLNKGKIESVSCDDFFTTEEAGREWADAPIGNKTLGF
tara:strand:+ start:2372 stop:2647 length:276 start_codon:yes stop_codon:yes gene_type:complete